MTFSECSIEVYEIGNPDFGVPVAKHIERLGRSKEGYWLPVLKDWAEANRLEIAYVDNCWIRVETPAAKLREFLDFQADDNSISRGRLDRLLTDNHRYVLVAEEY